MATRRAKRRLMNQINVVPYIDVMLVLLVIFMVTAPMTNPGVVELPSVGGAALKQPAAPVVVTVKNNKTLELDGKPMPRDEMLYAIKQKIAKNPQQSVVIAADKGVRYDDVVSILSMLKQGKVEKVGLLAQPES
jgi:biopolymer transport protein TolR